MKLNCNSIQNKIIIGTISFKRESNNNLIDNPIHNFILNIYLAGNSNRREYLYYNIKDECKFRFRLF